MNNLDYLATRAEAYAEGYAEGYAAALPKVSTEAVAAAKTNELIRKCRANLDEWLLSEEKKAHAASNHDLQWVIETCQAAYL